MLELFSASHGAKLYVASRSECVRIAAADLRRNIEALTAQKTKITLSQTDPTAADIVIAELSDGVITDLDVPNAAEAYAVSVSEAGVRIVGRDALGTVYGIYAFAEQVLGFDPMYLFTDVYPEKRESLVLENTVLTSKPSVTVWRGWFINDEDLLTEFGVGGGKRRLDYPFYQTTVAPTTLDMVLETALRCGMNFIIPASFVNIANPAEEALVSAAYRRGLYISQHHIEPLGVSHFSAETYLSDRGIDESVSFVENPERMKEIWRCYAEKWAKYKDRVIWQLGLRGRGDKAVWKSDPSVDASPEARGALISSAVAAQHAILCDVLGTEDFLSTMTLWLEGAELYGKGYLTVPENTVVVFSDIGTNQLFGDDFYGVERRKGARYGIYSHVAFWGHGPHLSEGASPEKILFTFREAEREDSLYYAVTNVSNVRPLHFSALLGARIQRDPTGFDLDAYRRDYYRSIFGDAGEKVDAAMRRYYRAMTDLGQELLRGITVHDNAYYHDYGELPFTNYAASDGALIYAATKYRTKLGLEHLDGEILAELDRSEREFTELLAELRGMRDTVPERARGYLEVFPIFETRYMLLLTQWCRAAFLLQSAETVEAVDGLLSTAVAKLREITDSFAVLETGKWKGWMTGDRKINIPRRIRETEALAEKRRTEILGK